MIHTITKHLAALAVALLPASGMATDFTVDGIWYDITSTSTVEVAGARRDAGSGGRIVIPSTVEYRGQTYRVTAIGNKAFENDTYVTSVSIPGSVTSFGSGCFQYCTSLTSVNLHKGLTTFGYNCFYGCTALTAINLPEGFTTLNDFCFQGCTSLASVSLPESLTTIGSSCFAGCPLTSANLSENLTYLGWGAFSSTKLTAVTLPEGLATVDGSCFSDCTSLTSVCFKGATEIGETMPSRAAPRWPWWISGQACPASAKRHSKVAQPSVKLTSRATAQQP